MAHNSRHMAGVRLHHTVGHGPLRKADRTEVLAYEPDSRLGPEVHAWPAGSVSIALTARPVGQHT